MQTSDEHSVATPENWCEGEQVIVPPPSTTDEVGSRQQQGDDYTDWYFSRKTI